MSTPGDTAAPTAAPQASGAADPARRARLQALRRPRRGQRRRRSRSPSARSSRSSAPTAPARRRSSTCSPGSTARRTGAITFDGQGHHRASARTAITQLGVARTFQNIRLFGTMTALENVLVGQHARMKAGLFGSILRSPRQRREEREAREHARELLAYVGPARATSTTSSRSTSPTATSAAWRSPARSRPTPSCCCSTSRPPGMNPNESAQLTELHAAACATSAGSRSCSSSTT